MHANRPTRRGLPLLLLSELPTVKARQLRIAENSYMTVADQSLIYRLEVGVEAAERQEKLLRIRKGLCVCTPRRWREKGSSVSRVVHSRGCPRRRPWMDEAGLS